MDGEKTKDMSQMLLWEKLKKAVKNKLYAETDFFNKYKNIRKRRRSKKVSLVDSVNGIHPCMIKRPSIILPEDIEQLNRKTSASKPRRHNSIEEMELSDFEDEKTDKAEEKLNDSQEYYLRSCRRYGVVPVSTFYKQLKGISVVLKNHRFMGNEFKACAVALLSNETVTHLDIEGGHIGPSGMSHLSDIIYHADVISKLNLTKNSIGTTGLTLLKDAMDKNLHLQDINLSDNNITDTDCDIIRQILEGNNLLQSLNLSNNYIGSIGAEHIARGLITNEELKLLDLSWNKVTGKGAAAIGYMLIKNSEINIINLAWNGLEECGAHALAHGLDSNKTLKELDISSNRINQNGLAKLLKGLKENKALEALKIADNPISSDGAYMVLLCTEFHENLSYIDFGNLPVNEEFEQKISEIRKHRRLVVKFGKIIRNQKKDTGDDTMYISGDPRTILLEYARITQIHILDMFKALDIDRSHSITWDEFRQGIKQNKLPIRPKDIEKIIQSIDVNMDGEVDFSELILSQKAHKKKVEALKARGDNTFQGSSVGVINANLRKWMTETTV